MLSIFNILLYQRITYLFIGELILLFLFVVAIYYLSLVDKSKIFNNQFIIGNWERKGVSPEGEEWNFQYRFYEKNMEMSGTPDYEAQANYRVLKEDENLLIIELYNITGDWEGGNPFIQVAVDKKGDRLTIDHRSGYKRIEV